ncbi:tetratricopeptide repeat protein [candidate division TA06 bacterium]|uniref:Tetratricopeptide repeat protein n=1 Tax=candidate division TA06 bacterium TaxID=2250710 RepID=A0A933IA44_UNCT6|nr:tetratricopeptide repeat protein [candidate division TA06 bacterium]
MKDQKIGTKYQVLEFLGEGSSSQVYKAVDLAGGQIVALKLFLADSININLVSQEFRLLAELRHPNLAAVYAYENFQAGCFYIMEFVPGPDILCRCRDLSFEKKCHKLIELCHALEYIHYWNIVHLDLKPSNLLLDEKDAVKLLDFGLAQSAACAPLKISGTPSYISPEVISGQSSDGRADLYSLGVLMYQIFAGVLPFEAPSLKDLVKKHLYQPPQPPLIYNASLPERLQSLILKLLNKDPNARPAGAGEVAVELARIIKQSPGESPDAPRLPFVFNSRLVGRNKEMAELRHAVQNAISGQGSTIFISGETGIGRTKLLTEFSLEAQLLECQVLWTRCYQPDTSAYDLIGQLLAQILPLAQNFCPQIISEFGPKLAEIVPAYRALPEVKNLPVPASLPAHEQRLRLLDAVAGFIIKTMEAVPPRATVIMLESIQWIDRESLEAVSHLMRNIARSSILVIGSFRNDDLAPGHHLPETIEALVAENLAEQFFLKRLSQSEVSELIRNIFPRIQNPEPLLTKIFAETEGNPLLIEEAVHYLMDSKFIERRHGQWQITSLTNDRLALPDGLTKAFKLKLKNLSPEQLLLMQSLAVMERPATAHQIFAITALDACQISKDLLYFKSQSLLTVLQEEKGDLFYGLHHSKIAREVYRSASPGLLSRLHRATAQILENQENHSLQELSALSRHWEAAGDPGKAREFHLLAGDGLAEFSKRQAIEHYRKAIELSPSQQDLPVLEKLQKLYYVSGEFQKALEAAQVLHLAKGPSPDSYYKMGRCQERLGNYESSTEYLRQGLTVSRNDPQSAARLMRAIAVTCISRGEYRTAEKNCQEALKLLPQNSKPSVEAEIYNTLGQAYWHLAEWSQALSVHRKSLAINEREGSLYGIADSHNNLGLVYYRMYDWDRAAESCQKSFAIREKIGDISGLAKSYNNLALISRHLYDWDKALEYHSKCLQTMERIGSSLETATSLVNIGLIHKAKGEWDRALWSYNRAIQLAATIGAKNIMLDAYIRKAEFYLALGGLKDCSLFCQKSLGMAEELGGRLEMGRALNISGRISQMRQQWDKAKEIFSQAREIFAELDIRAGEAFILKNLADLHRELGELDKAEAMADKALSLAQRVEEQQLVADVLLLKGELLEERGRSGLTYMEWSLEIATKVNTAETAWPIFSAIARHHVKHKRYDLALEQYQKILSGFKQALANISQPDLKSSYIFAPRRRQLFKDIKLFRQEAASYAG